MRVFALALTIGCATAQPTLYRRTKRLRPKRLLRNLGGKKHPLKRSCSALSKRVIGSAQAEVRGCYEAILTRFITLTLI